MSETELFLRSKYCQANSEAQVTRKFMRDPWLIIAKLEHRRGIGTTYVVPIRGVILDEKIPKLKYDGSILVYKWEVLVEANHNYLTRDIHNMPVCHKDIIYHIDFVYAIFLDFFNRKLEVFSQWSCWPHVCSERSERFSVRYDTLAYRDYIHSDIKTWGIVQCGSSWKITY